MLRPCPEPRLTRLVSTPFRGRPPRPSRHLQRCPTALTRRPIPRRRCRARPPPPASVTDVPLRERFVTSPHRTTRRAVTNVARSETFVTTPPRRPLRTLRRTARRARRGPCGFSPVTNVARSATFVMAPRRRPAPTPPRRPRRGPWDSSRATNVSRLETLATSRRRARLRPARLARRGLRPCRLFSSCRAVRRTRPRGRH